jgi:hypothetical protein
VSDHFFTFIAPPGRRKIPVQKHPNIMYRDYSLQNLNRFKIELSLMDWAPVMNSNEVNDAYSNFWHIYKTCHDANFPFKRQRFNKNIHKKQKFMTIGLLTSRKTKNKLHQSALAEPTAEKIAKYKNYKTIYFRIVRGAKRLYFTSKLNENVGNPKKTWETLNEILGKSKQKESLNQLIINNV